MDITFFSNFNCINLLIFQLAVFRDHKCFCRKNALSVVIERRIGKEKLVELLEALSHSEHYVKAAQRPQPLAKSAQDLLLDYHFTKFFKSAEGLDAFM